MGLTPLMKNLFKGTMVMCKLMTSQLRPKYTLSVRIRTPSCITSFSSSEGLAESHAPRPCASNFLRPHGRCVYNSAWARWMLRPRKSSRWYYACVELIRPHSSTVVYTQCFQLSNFIAKFGNFSDYPSNFLPKAPRNKVRFFILFGNF